MVYIPDPNDATQPDDSIIAETAAAEFRALKGKVNTLGAGVVNGTGARNIIMNGDAEFDQMNGGAIIVPVSGAYIGDGCKYFASNPSIFNTQTSTTALLPPGYTKVFTASVAILHVPAAAEAFALTFPVEGNAMKHLSYGTGGAKTSTLLFWLKSTVSGQHCAFIRNAANNRSFVAPVQYPVANIWQRFAVHIPGDNAGIWSVDSTLAGIVAFTLGCGPAAKVTLGLENSWVAQNAFGAFNSVDVSNNLAGSTNFQVTGIEWKDGVYTIADPQEVVPYSLKSVETKRYYHTAQVFVSAGAGVISGVDFQTSMRIAPVITGGAAGFTAVTGVDRANVAQTVAAYQQLVFDSRL